MIRLGLRDPGLLDEFNKSTAAEREDELGLRSGCQWEFQLSRAAGSALTTLAKRARAFFGKKWMGAGPFTPNRRVTRAGNSSKPKSA